MENTPLVWASTIAAGSLIRNLDDDFYGDWTFSGKTAPINTVGCTNPASPINGGQPLCGTGNAVADMLTGFYNSVGGFVPGPLSPTTEAGNPQDHVFSYLGPTRKTTGR